MNFWQSIQPRERLFLGGAAAALVLFLFFKFAIDPLFKHSADLDRQIVTARRQLAELRTMQQEYQRQKTVVDRSIINSRSSRISPSFHAWKNLLARRVFATKFST